MEMPAPIAQDVPRNVSTTDQNILRQKSFVDGCKVGLAGAMHEQADAGGT